MNRGSIVTVALQGDFGKARPALVVQSDLFAEHPSVTLLLMSSAMVDAPFIRITVVPSEQNGLRMPSQIAVDKMFTVRREKIGRPIGHLEDELMVAVNRSLLVFLGLA
ncbi:type II toxin-antitoxin system PemK/MazF family toxin [Burkholderia cenocepacia]|uniref:type II toxin-antitoxin system PemK/MazF family toxin n=1 Tax=Burkholderia cenocepacia TaxID=95486 RepID=UPI00078EAF6A|nr:type II toxin-antitoxin system PemK/MazF family toxin [Burkholderia cenocepacia]AMU15782.1 growth inhibitor PemK [Burkholderia cenocepacia]MCW3585750.1 type II toxin-antitoxin system PemK/MazF family toxin [Burkholderia cenocepacia]MCW3630998.1 type II toxin-antitoxin system PemK/MazF family toxin [Burkholderia cenocepacia]MCW3647955.1 type II toxin-antitoxin system PemK/MazF family toxin [Burkholderia cenocepacia]MCW5180522.1 type II toxin-antitoxin system PemK/MazF family toxin [Burkholde